MNPEIALTFDDGPNTTTTKEILSLLRKVQIPASFFVMGSLITEETTPVLREMIEQGCEIHNHSFSHTAFPELSFEEATKELFETDRRVFAATGKIPGFFRPPYLATDERTKSESPYPLIAGYGAEDWVPEILAVERARRIIDQMKDGAIILLHDKEGNEETVKALSLLIPELKKTYRFVTITELFSHKGIDPVRDGRLYSCVPERT